jgi:tetratricopeptide (TPR) repeat protein
VSYICYAVLYWTFVIYVDKKETLKLIRTLLITTTVASIYASFEHFGHSASCLFVNGEFSTNCWVQDVQFRVFGTFGQPNWLAAWLVAIIPLTWVTHRHPDAHPRHPEFISGSQMRINLPILKQVQDDKIKPILSGLFFTTLLFTKSRSGILAFAISYLIFWGFTLTISTRAVRSIMPWLTTFFILLATTLIGTPWTPSINQMLNKSNTPQVEQFITEGGTLLEQGGTESGSIRKIVWRGAIDLWRAYPILGTGTDTFANAYYEKRPIAHNNVSEWNFLYNRAHNEYLNFMATTGTLGILTYLLLIVSSLYVFLVQLGQLEIRSITIALLSGYTTILITNFFGFSTVPVAVLFFLFPALAFSLTEVKPSKHLEQLGQLEIRSILLFIPILLSTFYLLLALWRYWYADLNYGKGISLNQAQRYQEAVRPLLVATKLSPREALFHDELAKSYSGIATDMYQKGQNDLASSSMSLAIEQINKTTELAGRDIKLLKTKTATLADLGQLNPQYYAQAIKYLEILKALAPTEPTAQFRLALNFGRLGDNQEAVKFLLETIELKPDYESARLLLGLLYEDLKQPDLASQHYEYILKNINPNNKIAAENLKNLNKPQ